MSTYDYGIYGYGNAQQRRVFKDFPWLWAITHQGPGVSLDWVQVHNASITEGYFLNRLMTWWTVRNHAWGNLHQLWVYIQERFEGRTVGDKVVKLDYKKWGGEKYKNPIEPILDVYKGIFDRTLYLAFGHWHRKGEMCQSVIIYRPPKGIKSFEEFFKNPEIVDEIIRCLNQGGIQEADR